MPMRDAEGNNIEHLNRHSRVDIVDPNNDRGGERLSGSLLAVSEVRVHVTGSDYIYMLAVKLDNGLLVEVPSVEVMEDDEMPINGRRQREVERREMYDNQILDPNHL
jgi:hypothetical protein